MKLALLALILTIGLLGVGCTGAGRFSTTGGWSGPAVLEDQVFIGSQEGRLLALHALSGSSLWSDTFPPQQVDPLGRVLYGTPAVDGERVYFGTYDGRVYALNAEDGKEAWPSSVQVDGHIIGGPILAGTDQCIAANRSVVEGDVLLVGSTAGAVYALCAGDGSLAWRFPTEGEVWASPTVEGDSVYFGTQDGRLYAVALDKGTSLFKPFVIGGAIVASPLVADGKVFFGALDRKFYAVDARNGTAAWHKPFRGSNWFWTSAVTDGERVYAVSIDGALYALDPDTGAQRWGGDLGAMVLSAPVLVERLGEFQLVVATKDGRLSVRRTDRDQEERSCELTDAKGHSVKVKAPLGRMSSQEIDVRRQAAEEETPELLAGLSRWGNTIVVNTMDPGTVQVLNLEDGTCGPLLEF